MLIAILLFVFAVLAGAGVFVSELCGIPEGESRLSWKCHSWQSTLPAFAGDSGLRLAMRGNSGPPVTIRNLARRTEPPRNVLWPPPIFRFIGARLQLR